MQLILEALTTEEKEKILKISDKKSYKEGEVIVHEGTPGEEFYILKSGEIIITKGIEGKEDKTLSILEQGDFFGEMSLLDGGPHSANATALKNVEVLSIKRELFENMLKTDYQTASRFLFAVIKVMSERLRATNEELVALYNAGRIIGSSLKLKELLSQTLRLLMDATDSSCGIFLLINEFTGGLEIGESNGINEINKELAAELLKEPLGTIVNDVLGNDKFKGKINSTNEISSFIASSLKVKEKPVGIIVLGKESKDGFTRGKLNLLIAVANQIATAVENAHFNEEVAARKKLRQVYIKY
ncbi:hypothetical protein AUJ66_00425 [Candidatus Desantisbacteria bacterium CG1_02_38_46]|uniref:Cyclic nucleotide-binding domain-containing protein n=3 Tax=unclassified Candidatus Desantisiibacteriota TaxID=3106372 RepID=A0A2H9P9N3_9BACT|nr:MAG: hypothetical protein AUJ66_00425 [Candidatus Desantisbacteria bacterium CG1_02_38_46]PIU51718.1 MAG: hypothetical protein COS91_03160 [Candidatus Desantisbacteria bacterium CG07_land_8_20_14_0_80_39_15]PIZ15010.1 MAG: hypothetical protein COY51_06700 [Candidatus Desantisbacteria bacterium CG_4_10_14_0_8_um_filter_39_17]